MSDVLLKWTLPIRSIDVMLVCIGMGVDRFNADAKELLAGPVQRSKITPLMVPLAGADF